MNRRMFFVSLAAIPCAHASSDLAEEVARVRRLALDFEEQARQQVLKLRLAQSEISVAAYRGEDGRYHAACYDLSFAEHDPPIPDIPENRAIRDLLMARRIQRV